MQTTETTSMSVSIDEGVAGPPQAGAHRLLKGWALAQCLYFGRGSWDGAYEAIQGRRLLPTR